MIGLDTSVLVRYVMQDDRRQSAQASRVIESFTAETPGWVPVVAIVELVWVLESRYDLDRAQVSRVLAGMLVAKELKLDSAAEVALAMSRYRVGRAEFADCLSERLANRAGCRETLTFDTRAARDAGMTLIDR